MSPTDELRVVLGQPAGRTSAGHPYLPTHAWVRFRDWIPHLFGEANDVLRAVVELEAELGPDVEAAAGVIRQVVNTAQVTAPPDLWLMRYVVSALAEVGVLMALRNGDVVEAGSGGTLPEELRVDLDFLVSRGVLIRQGEGWRASDRDSAHQVLSLAALPAHWPVDLSRRWRAVFDGDPTDLPLLKEILTTLPEPVERQFPAWMANGVDVELGWRLVPLVLGLRGASQIGAILETGRVDIEITGEAATAFLKRTGTVDASAKLTATGARMLSRGPGPFGIIEAYHPYMAALPRILREGRGAVHVSRGTNVAASQDANRRTFERANNALDRYCADNGFSFEVFIEHAVGQGEAIRQRWERAGDSIQYVGVDLESEALAATASERKAGRLPGSLRLIQADIGQPEQLLDALAAAGLDARGAVMVVGNGFHEVRHQTDARMVAVLEGYARAGIVLIFTEESALALDDLLHTAWNTYHAGFAYVHKRSGQGLRPATPQPPSRLGPPLPASWSECAERAGYVRLEAYCSRSRTIYPHTPPSGTNPSISVNHFFVPST